MGCSSKESSCVKSNVWWSWESGCSGWRHWMHAIGFWTLGILGVSAKPGTLVGYNNCQSLNNKHQQSLPFEKLNSNPIHFHKASTTSSLYRYTPWLTLCYLIQNTTPASISSTTINNTKHSLHLSNFFFVSYQFPFCCSHCSPYLCSQYSPSEKFSYSLISSSTLSPHPISPFSSSALLLTSCHFLYSYPLTPESIQFHDLLHLRFNFIPPLYPFLYVLFPKHLQYALLP